MAQTRKSSLIILLSFFLVCLTICVIYGLYTFTQRSLQEKAVLEGIAIRTGLPPDWLAIRQYVYCDITKPGTSKEEVDKGLTLIGKYYSPNEEDPLSQIDFTDPSTYYNLSPLLISDNEEWKVISSGAGEFNHGPRASCELERIKIRTISPP
jgi:hypothetical protein